MTTPQRSTARVWNAFHEAIRVKEGSPEDERAFRVHANATTARVAQAILFLGPVAALLWWPGDYLIFQDPEIRAKVLTWRIGTILALGPTPILIAFSERVRRNPIPAVMMSNILGSIMMTWCLGRMGGTDTPWFGATMLIPFETLFIQVPLRRRVALTTTLAVLSLLAFFLPYPQYATRMAVGNAIGLGLFSILLSTAIGHAMYRLLHSAFLAERALARVNDGLEEQVRIKTADLRSLATRLEVLREQERSDIARDLHDDVGQLLSAVRFEVDMMGKRARRVQVDINVDDVHFLLDRMLETFRRILRSLRPRALDDFGFVAAAEWLAKDSTERTGIPVQLQVVPPDLLLDGPRATAAYRVLQEALSNALRHSGATRIEVDIRGSGALFELAIRDNGRGIPARSTWRTDAMGVIGMRERAESLGGHTHVTPQEGGGTSVVLTLPFEVRQEGAA